MPLVQPMPQAVAPAGGAWVAPPKAAAALVRAPSYEGPASRGPSPAPGAALSRCAGVSSPPVSHRSRYSTTASPPMSHRAGCQVTEVPMPRTARPRTSRYTSRSAPPQRYASGSLRRPCVEAVCVSMSPACTPAHPMRVSRSTSVPSTQSLPSVASCASVHTSAPPTTAVGPAMPALRAHSASALPVSVEVMPSRAVREPASAVVPSRAVPEPATAAVASMPTLSTPQGPPWAQVLPPQQPHSARPAAEGEDVRDQLEQIKQEVRSVGGELRTELRTVALRQMHSDELEHTRQRLQNMESTVQLHQKDVQEERHQNDELRAQLAQTQVQLQEAEQRLLREVEEHERTQRELIRARHDYDCAVVTKERLEMEHRSSQDRSEACVEQMTARYEQKVQEYEQLVLRCQDLQSSEQELQERVRQLGSRQTSMETQATDRERELGGRLGAAAEAARRLEGEKRVLEVEFEKAQQEHEKAREELEKARQQQRETEQETRELRCRSAVLEDQFRDAQEQRQRSEQDQQRAEQDLRQWYQKFIESNKENTSLQRSNQDHKRDIWELENQLRQERNVASITKPGEYLKLMRAHEGDSMASDNSRLKKVLSKTQCDLDLCIRRLGEQERLIKELQECCKANRGAN